MHDHDDHDAFDLNCAIHNYRVVRWDQYDHIVKLY